VARPIPSLDTPVIDLQSGKMTQVWFEYFATREKLSQLPDVAQTVAPLDGQVLVWSAANGKFVYGTN
jgi:hypothetical protein